MTVEFLSRRRVQAGAFVVAIGAAMTVAGLAAGTDRPAMATCPAGETADAFTGVCIPHLVPNSPQITAGEGGLPSIDGVPCTGHNSNECIGLAEEQQPPTPSPALPSLP